METRAQHNPRTPKTAFDSLRVFFNHTPDRWRQFELVPWRKDAIFKRIVEHYLDADVSPLKLSDQRSHPVNVTGPRRRMCLPDHLNVRNQNNAFSGKARIRFRPANSTGEIGSKRETAVIRNQLLGRLKGLRIPGENDLRCAQGTT